MPLRSREYEDRTKSVGFEKATAWAVSELIERFNMLERNVNECGNQMIDLIELFAKMVDGTAEMKQHIQALERRNQVDESHPHPSDDWKQ
jgi:Asp-tRNA(Asn)/Glu-tRNA(Gln) amidotransferase B subunit